MASMTSNLKVWILRRGNQLKRLRQGCWRVIWIIPILVVIFGQNVRFDPLGSPCIGLSSCVLQIIKKKYHLALSWNSFCGYFAWLNGQNRNFNCIISMFAVIFDQNVGIWHTWVSMYSVTPHWYGIYLEEIWSCFVLNVYLWFLFITRWHK